MLPIDKIIGKIYPVFAFALIFMAIALMVCLFIKWPSIPEIWDGISNMGEASGLISGQPIFPCLFITIACGAVSGFHATQSPLMARCIKDEKLGRPVFYGAMIKEGIFWWRSFMDVSLQHVIFSALQKQKRRSRYRKNRRFL